MTVSTDPAAIRDAVRVYVLETFLPGEDPAALTDSTALIGGRIVDSLGLLKLVTFLEERYGIEIAAHEADADHFDTIEEITALVRSKL